MEEVEAILPTLPTYSLADQIGYMYVPTRPTLLPASSARFLQCQCYTCYPRPPPRDLPPMPPIFSRSSAM